MKSNLMKNLYVGCFYQLDVFWFVEHKLQTLKPNQIVPKADGKIQKGKYVVI